MAAGKFPTKYYPIQGSNKFQTVNFPVTSAFVVDFATQVAGTYAVKYFPAGSLILGFYGKITEAMETAGSGTVQMGFTSLMVTSAHASGTATVGTILAPHFPTSGTVVSHEAIVLTANTAFNCIVATNTCTAGKADVFVTWLPPVAEDLSTDEFPVYVTV